MKNNDSIIDYSDNFEKVKTIILFLLDQKFSTSSATLESRKTTSYILNGIDIKNEANNPELVFDLFSSNLKQHSENFIRDLNNYFTELEKESNFSYLNQYFKRFNFRNAFYLYKFLLNNGEKIDNFTILKNLLENRIQKLKEKFIPLVTEFRDLLMLKLLLILAENTIYQNTFASNFFIEDTYRPEIGRGLEFIAFLFNITIPLQIPSENQFKDLFLEPSSEFVTGWNIKSKPYEIKNDKSSSEDLIDRMVDEMKVFPITLRQLIHSLLFGDVCDAFSKEDKEFHFALTTSAVMTIYRAKYENLKNLHGFVCPICHNFTIHTESLKGWLEGMPPLSFILSMRKIFNVNKQIELLGLEIDHKITFEYLINEYEDLTAYDLLLRLPNQTILSLNEKLDILVNNSHNLSIYDKFSDYFDSVSTITILNRQKAFETDIKAHVKGVEGYYEKFKKEMDEEFN